ncbi:Monocarboxylate transporter 7 [Paragonimus heterotremus]|uniref:Monocarboxylate transporter 7 n=1 Tax=Paragonimus heterotremus TaxID=100268 RepID=A0A8J4TDK5_9TREM|nr:Monocarboxylate transporter 7 [Paragonimus heterotremus]
MEKNDHERTVYEAGSLMDMRPLMSARQKAIDRGPAWTVAIFTCIVLGMHYGILNCGALFYPALMEMTGQPVSVVSWLVTGQFAMTFCLGIGLGVSVVRVVGIAAEYFEIYRTLALAVCTSGAGLGTFIYSKLGAHMIDTYSWRVALMGYALIHLNIIPICLILRPLPPEPALEPTVMIPAHPELKVCEMLPTNSYDIRIAGSQNVLLRKLSVNNICALNTRNNFGTPNIAGQCAAVCTPSETKCSRQPPAAKNLRVIIEFVRGSRVGVSDQCIIEPVSFLADPGALVASQIETAVKNYLFELDNACEHVLVPVIFIVDEIETILSLMNRTSNQGPIITTKEFSDLLTSCPYMGSVISTLNQEPDPPQTPIFIGDSFASLVITAQERRQTRKLVKDTVRQAENRVHSLTNELIATGLHVSPTPIIALLDRSQYLFKNDMVLVTTEEQAQVSGCHGLLNDIIPKEVEHTDVNQRLDNMCSNPHQNEEPKKINRKITPAWSSVVSFGSQTLMANHSEELNRGIVQNLHRLIQQSMSAEKGSHSRDILTSVVSVQDIDEATAMVISKFEHKDEVHGTEENEDASGKFLLLNPLFITFLMTRTLVFITDSIIFAHLNNFGLESGLMEDQAAGLLSFVGIASMIARLGTGFAGQFALKCGTRYLTASCLLVVALYTILMPLYPTYLALSVFAIIYGILVSPSFAFAPLMAYEITGPVRYDEAVSFWFQFEAVGYLVGGPIGGAIKEIDNKYTDCFILAGVSDLVASVILLFQGFLLAGTFLKLKRRICHADSTQSDDAVDLEKSSHSLVNYSGH